jgi:hypothetical protein
MKAEGKNAEGVEAEKDVKSTCITVKAPACVLTATDTVTSEVNHAAKKITINAALAYTANEWCDSGDLVFSLLQKGESDPDFSEVELNVEELKADKAYLLTDTIDE